jgi:hypothetical protein
MKSRASLVVVSVAATLVGLAFGANKAFGANSPPLSGTWNIASSGKAGSSGDLVFRVTPGDGGDPVEISVPVIGGTSEDGVARNIRRALSSQLRADRFNVSMGEGANVVVSDPRGQPNFSVELLDSDVENVRVLVQSVAPVAPPTVPEQQVPANPPQGNPATPPAPGNAAPPANALPEIQQSTPPGATPPPNAPQPSTPAPSNAPPPSNATPSGNAPPSASPATPPNSTGGAGAPASTPPPGI